MINNLPFSEDKIKITALRINAFILHTPITGRPTYLYQVRAAIAYMHVDYICQ